VHIRVGRNAFGLTAAFGSLWVMRRDPSEVIEVLGDTLWIGTGRTSRDVLRLDPRTKQLTTVPVGQLSPTSIVATLRMPATPQLGTFAPDGTLWVAREAERRHARRRRAQPRDRLDPGRPGCAGRRLRVGSLWVPSYAGSTVLLRFSAR